MKKDIAKVKKVKKVNSYPKTIVKKSFAGKGIFALEEIKRGTKILQYIGKKLTTEQANLNSNRYIFEIDDNWSIDGNPAYNTARYFNHSCKPNAESILEEPDRIFIAARKKIIPGEEITFDYGKEYINEYIKKTGCRCSQCSRVS
jgi:SET domain-containing protein